MKSYEGSIRSFSSYRVTEETRAERFVSALLTSCAEPSFLKSTLVLFVFIFFVLTLPATGFLRGEEAQDFRAPWNQQAELGETKLRQYLATAGGLEVQSHYARRIVAEDGSLDLDLRQRLLEQQELWEQGLLPEAKAFFPRLQRLEDLDSSVEDLAQRFYGERSAAGAILAANRSVNFTELQAGDEIYLPRIGQASGLVARQITELGSPTAVHSSVARPASSVAAGSPAVLAAPEQGVSPEQQSRPAASGSQELGQQASGQGTEEGAREGAVQTSSASSSQSSAHYVIDVPSQEVLDLYIAIVSTESSVLWDAAAVTDLAQCIVNRVRQGWGSLYEVLTTPGQFDVYTYGYYLNAQPTEAQIAGAMAALRGEGSLSPRAVYFCNDWVYDRGGWWHTLPVEKVYDGMMFFGY